MRVKPSGYPLASIIAWASSIAAFARISWDIAAIWAMVVGVVILNASPIGQALANLRLMVALPVLLFFPGYLLSIALFVRSGALTDTERLAFGIASSSAIVVFLGLFLYFVDLPIDRYHFVVVLGILLGLLSVIATWRRATSREDECYIPWRALKCVATSGVVRFSTMAMFCLCAGGIGAVAYTLATSTPMEHYTEFYVLRPETKKADLPLTIEANDEFSFTVVVRNLEGRPQSYRLHMSGDNGYLEETYLGMLDNDLTWERQYHMPASTDMLLTYLRLELFVDGQSVPYRELHLWLETVPALP